MYKCLALMRNKAHTQYFFRKQQVQKISSTLSFVVIQSIKFRGIAKNKALKEWHQTFTHLCEGSEVIVRVVIDVSWR